MTPLELLRRLFDFDETRSVDDIFMIIEIFKEYELMRARLEAMKK